MRGSVLPQQNTPIAAASSYALETIDRVRGLGQPGMALAELIKSKGDEAKMLEALNSFKATGAPLSNLFCQPRNGNLDPRAINLFRKLAFSSQNQELKQISKELICQHFKNTELSKARKHSPQKQKLYKDVCDFLTTTDKDQKDTAGIQAITTSGVLFTKKGEDHDSPVTDPDAPITEDIARLGEPLPGCYSQIRRTEIGKIVYDLLASEAEGFRELNVQVYEGLLDFKMDEALKDQVALQATAAEKKLKEAGLVSKDGSIYTFRKGTFHAIEPGSSKAEEKEAEIGFLMKNGLSREEAQEFNFNFQDMIKGLYNYEEAMAGKANPRDKAVKNFMLGYSLLHFRKSRINLADQYQDHAAKVLGYAITSTDREKDTADVDNQIALMTMIVGKDSYIDKSGSIRNLFKKIIEEDVSGTIGTLGISVMAQIEEQFEAHMKAVRIELNDENYGQASPRINIKTESGTETREPRTRKEYDQYLGEITATQTTLLTRAREKFVDALSPDQKFIDTKQVDSFIQAWSKRLDSFLLSPEALETKGPAALLERDEEHKLADKPLPLAANIQAEFQRFIEDNSAPDSVKYVRANWDEIFKVEADAISLPSCHTIANYKDALVSKLKANIKQAENIGTDLQVRLKSGSPSLILMDIANSDDLASLSPAQKTIRDIIHSRNDVDSRNTKANHQFISELLNASVGSFGDTDRNLVGIMETTRELHSRLDSGSITQDEFNEAHKLIYVDALGFSDNDYNTAIATRTDDLNFFNGILGNGSRNPATSFAKDMHKNGISSSEEHPVDAYTQICFIDAISNSIGDMVATAQVRAEEDRDSMIEGMVGTLFKDANLGIDAGPSIEALQTTFKQFSSTAASIETIEDPLEKADQLKALRHDFETKLPGVYSSIQKLTQDKVNQDQYFDTLIQSPESLDLISYIIELCLKAYDRFTTTGEDSIKLAQNKTSDIRRPNNGNNDLGA